MGSREPDIGRHRWQTHWSLRWTMFARSRQAKLVGHADRHFHGLVPLPSRTESRIAFHPATVPSLDELIARENEASLRITVRIDRSCPRYRNSVIAMAERYPKIEHGVVRTIYTARYGTVGAFGSSNRPKLIPIGKLAQESLRLLCAEDARTAGAGSGHFLSAGVIAAARHGPNRRYDAKKASWKA